MEPRICAEHEIEQIIAAAPDQWWACYLRVLADTGLRKMEALHLRWTDVDLDGGFLNIATHRAASFTAAERAYPVIAWTVKARESERSVPLSDAAATLLQRMRVANGDSAYVFLSLARLRQLEPKIGPRGLRHGVEPVPNTLPAFKAIQHDAGIDDPPGTLHDLRKTWCTRMAKILPMPTLQRYAGHADIATTSKYYTRTTADDAAKVREALRA